jgi:3-isopropylmalate/(R)-2-methylmalate dehydratase small subunit
VSAPLRGAAHVYDLDNIDTDRIIPGKRTKTLVLTDLARYALEDLDPGFAARVAPGDILVVGRNFGCGSSREQAPVALKAAGVGLVIGRSFARIFYRNAINIGLPVLEIGDAPHEIASGHTVQVDAENGRIIDLDNDCVCEASRLPREMLEILREGGLVNYLVKHGDYRLLPQPGEDT